MDENKITKHVAPRSVRPEVRIANFFRVRPGKAWHEHRIPDLELIMFVDGAFQAFDPEHETTELRPGDVLLIRPGYPCTIEQTQSQGGVIACIHFELVRGRKWAKGDYEIQPRTPWVIRTGGDTEVIDLFRQCAAEFTGAGLYRTELMAAIFAQIWMRLMRHMMGNASTEHSSRLQAMLGYLRRNAIAGVGRRELAREFHLTPEYVNQLFRRYIGMPPGEVVQRERISQAVQLLTEGRCGVAEAAARTGFSDPRYFSRVFRRIMQRPPSSYLS